MIYLLYLVVLLMQWILSIIIFPFTIIYELFTEKNNSKKNNSKKNNPEYIAPSPSIVYEKSYFNEGVKTLQIKDFHNNLFRVDCRIFNYCRRYNSFIERDRSSEGIYNSLEEAKNKIDSICFEGEQGSLGKYYGYHVYKGDGLYHYTGKSTPSIDVLLKYIEERKEWYEKYDKIPVITDLPF